MSFNWPEWETDRQHHAKRIFDIDSGGWFYQIRDDNHAFSCVWAPNMEKWAFAIGKGIIAAQRAALPVALMPDTARIRREKQPVPKR